MVDADVDKAAGQFFEFPDDFHAACGVQRPSTMVKMQLSIFGIDSILRNPTDLQPRADARHTDDPTRRCLRNKSVVAVMRKKLRSTRQIGGYPEDLNERRPDGDLIGKVHFYPLH